MELLENPGKSSDIVAEFLKIRSGDDILKMKGLDVENLEKNLNDMYATLDQIPKMTVDMSALSNGFKALQLIIDNSQVITNNVTDHSADFKTEIINANAIGIMDIDYFFVAVEKMQKIQRGEMTNLDASKGGDLIALKEAVSQVHNHLRIFQRYNSTMKSIFKIRSMIGEMKDLEVLANVSMAFGDNFQVISTLQSQLGALKSEIDSLKPVINKQKSMPKLSNISGLSAIINDFIDKKKKNISLKLTIGFFGNPDNIPKMFEELKTDALKVPLAQGRDLKSLEKYLGQLMSFHGKLAKAQKTWTVLTSDEGKRTEESADVINNLLSGREVQDVPFSPLSIQSCFENLKRPTALDAGQLSNLFQSFKTLKPQVDIWEQFLQTHQNEIASLDAKLLPIVDLLKSINETASILDFKNVRDSLRSYKNIDQILASLSAFQNAFGKVFKSNPFMTIKGANIDYSLISAVSNSLDQASMASMLNCLQTATYNSKDVIPALKLASSVQEIKGNEQKFLEIQKFVKEVMAMKQELIDIQSSVESRDRKTEEKSLASLKKSKNVLKDMGFGIQALQQLVKILEGNDSVMVAVNAEDPLKSAVAAIPEANTVWTDKNRNEMGVMIKELKTLEQTAGTLKKDNLSEIWKIFSETNRVQGVSIDAKVFNDPISKKLATNQDPMIQTSSKDFEKIGSLDLNFAMHHANLQKAFQTLTPLQDLLEDILWNKNSDADYAYPQALIISLIIGGTVAVLLVLIGGVIGLCVNRRYFHEKQKWRYRERHWIYEGFYTKESSINNFGETVGVDRFSIAKAQLKQGCHVDLYSSYQLNDTLIFATPLLIAVQFVRPKYVELLIRAGADRSLCSSEGLTPQQLLKKMFEEYGKTRKELKEIATIFKKLEKKTFRPRIRDLMPIDKFIVSFAQFYDKRDKDTLKKFENKLGNVVSIKEVSSSTTHLICNTDKHGVVDVEDVFAINKDDPFFVQGLSYCISRPTILVKLSWVHDCLKNKKNFHKDYDHRVTKFRYNGKVYKTLDEWKKLANHRAIPCLANVRVAYETPDEDEFYDRVRDLVAGLGASFNSLEELITGSAEEHDRPYWFPKMNCHWILYPAKEKKYFDETMSHMKNRMTEADMATAFEKMTVEQFLEKLLSLNKEDESRVEKVKATSTVSKTTTGTSTQGSITPSKSPKST